MSYFSETLRHLLSERNLTQDELSAASGIERSLISRLLREKIPSREQLAALCAAISPDNKDKVALLEAHLRDEALPAQQAAKLLDRNVSLASGNNTPQAHSRSVSESLSALPKNLQADIELISIEALQMIELREVIRQWALLIRRYQKQDASASKDSSKKKRKDIT